MVNFFLSCIFCRNLNEAISYAEIDVTLKMTSTSWIFLKKEIDFYRLRDFSVTIPRFYEDVMSTVSFHLQLDSGIIYLQHDFL